MTSSVASPSRSPYKGMASRWVPMLVISILLHLIVIASVSDVLLLPTPAASHAYRAPDVVAATLIAPPTPATPQTPSTAQALANAPAPTPKPAARIRPSAAKPAVAQTAVPEQAAPVTPVTSRPSDQESASAPSSTEVAEASSSATMSTQTAPQEAPAYRIKLLPSATLKYDIEKTPVNGATMHGNGTISWQTDQKHYAIEGEFGVLFITALRFKSTGTIEQTGIAPELYAEKRLRRSETNTHFHRERQTVSFSASTNSYPRVGDEQDRASIIWQLAAIGRGDSEHFYPGATISMVVAGTREAEPWQITIVGLEQVGIDGKQIETWRLLRAPRPGSYDQTLEFWLAPELGWYPVRLRYTEANGDVLDMVLSSLNVSTPSQSEQ